jgi:hypothetical protein
MYANAGDLLNTIDPGRLELYNQGTPTTIRKAFQVFFLGCMKQSCGRSTIHRFLGVLLFVGALQNDAE